MTAPVWSTPAGFLGTATERTFFNRSVVALNATSYTVISGALPAGLSLSSNGNITGRPNSIANENSSQFVIRASNTDGIADRTFTLAVQGALNFAWVSGSSLSVLPHIPVNIPLVADFVPTPTVTLTATASSLFNVLYIDTLSNVDTGQNGVWRVISGSGLSAGTTITNVYTDFNSIYNGYAISIDPPVSSNMEPGTVITLHDDLLDRHITYSVNSALPKGIYFDVNSIVGTPTDPTVNNLPNVYRFDLSATTGEVTTSQSFVLQVANLDNYTADATYLNASGPGSVTFSKIEPPIWITPSDLGGVEVMNKDIIPIEIYDPMPDAGPITIVIPTGTDRWYPDIDYKIGDLVVYYPGDYLFLGNWDADNNNPPLSANQHGARPGWQYRVSVPGGPINLGQGYQRFQIGDLIIYNGSAWHRIAASEHTYFCNTEHFSAWTFNHVYWDLIKFPPYLTIDQTDNLLYVNPLYIPNYSDKYTFVLMAVKTYTAYNTSVSVYREFNIEYYRNVNNPIVFTTDADLGNLIIGYTSSLEIVADHVNSPVPISYEVTGGALPPGLTFDSSGIIIGSVAVGTPVGPYTFVVTATDLYGQTASKGFYILVSYLDSTQYTEIYVQPFLSNDKRSLYNDFISNAEIFPRDLMYRINDKDFGIQYSIKMVLEFAIKSLDLAKYIPAITQNFNKRRLYFGNVKMATAQDSNGNSLYDVVYVDIVDNLVNNQGTSVKNVVYMNREEVYYPASIQNMQIALEQLVLPTFSYVNVDEKNLPVYMTTPQSTGTVATEYISVVPFCYTLPGYGRQVLDSVIASGFDFKQLDFEIDRIIVQNSADNDTAKYLIFDRANMADQIPDDRIVYGPEQQPVVTHTGNILGR